MDLKANTELGRVTATGTPWSGPDFVRICTKPRGVQKLQIWLYHLTMVPGTDMKQDFPRTPHTLRQNTPNGPMIFSGVNMYPVGVILYIEPGRWCDLDVFFNPGRTVDPKLVERCPLICPMEVLFLVGTEKLMLQIPRSPAAG